MLQLSDPVELNNLKKEIITRKKMLDRKDQTIKTQEEMITDLKSTLDKKSTENEELRLRCTQLQSKCDEMEINFDSVLKSYKHTIEQKQLEIEEMQIKVSPMMDNDLQRLRIRNEVEHAYKLDVQYKEQQVEELQDQINQLRNKLELEKQKYQLLQSEHEVDRNRLREKHNYELKQCELKFASLKDVEQMNIKEMKHIQSLQEQYESIRVIAEERDKIIISLRRALETHQNDKNRAIEQLVSELETERQAKRRLLSDNERLQDITKQLESKVDSLLKRDQTAPILANTQEKAYQEIQRQLNDYIKLFDAEKDAKRGLEKKMQDLMKQTRKEKAETEKLFEERIHDLTNQLRDERSSINKLQVKIKEYLHQITILNTENLEIRERVANNPQPQQSQLHHQNPSKYVENAPASSEETDYRFKKLKAKYQKLKEKLKEANDKIMQLLSQRLKSGKENAGGQQIAQNQDNVNTIQPMRANIQDYHQHYRLSGNPDYTQNPYQNAMPSDEFQLDIVSKQLRDDIYYQKQRLEDYKNKVDVIYPNKIYK